MNLHCDLCDDFVNFEADFPLTLERQDGGLNSGDTLWLNADFASVLDRQFREDVRVGQGGGLLLLQVLEVDGGDTLRRPAGGVTYTAENAALLPDRPNFTSPATTLRYSCTEEACRFRVGVRVDQPGEYLLEARAVNFENVSGELSTCEQITFTTTSIAMPQTPNVDSLVYAPGADQLFSDALQANRFGFEAGAPFVLFTVN